MKRAGGAGAIAKTLQVLVDDESTSTADSDLSDLISAHRSYAAAFQSFVEISRKREEALVSLISISYYLCVILFFAKEALRLYFELCVCLEKQRRYRFGIFFEENKGEIILVVRCAAW